MTRSKFTPAPSAAELERIWLVAECEATRLILERGIALGLNVKKLSPLVDARAAALEALAEHMKLVRSDDFAFAPPADRHRTRTKNNPAA